jgi:hypothetical protein
MPDKRSHRGPHPSDAQLLAADKIPDIRDALADYSLLLTKVYGDKGSLKLVGDRFSLTERQRLTVMRRWFWMSEYRDKISPCEDAFN